MNNEKIELFCISDFNDYRTIYDRPERDEADKIYEETGDIKKVKEFCKKIIMQDRANKLKKEANLSKRFTLRTFDNFKIETDIQKNAFKTSKKYAEKIEQMIDEGVNVAFAGNGCVGTGKTHLAYSIANYALDKGVPVKVLNVLKLVNTLKEFDPNFRKQLIGIEVLVIDDLGKEQGTPWLASELYGIINERYEDMKPTIITTEDTFEEIKLNYKVSINGVVKDKGKSMLSRFMEDFVLIELTGEDFRLKREAA